MSKLLSGIDTIKVIRKTQNKTLLAFSGGKDAVAAWLTIRPYFDEVVPVYMYIVPGLEIVEESLSYYEQYFGTKIVRVPHPSLLRWLRGNVFRPPEQILVVEQAEVPNISYEDVFAAVREEKGLKKNVFYATGVRAADSPMRRIALSTHGAISQEQLKYHPVHDLKKADLLSLFKKYDIKLSREYKYFGRTFDGLDIRFIKPLKDHFPKDYEKVRELFPFVELELFRFGAL